MSRAQLGMSFEEWTGYASEEEIAAMKQTTKKRFTIFLLLSLIPLLNWITMGLAIFCYNNYSILKSRGRSNGSDLFRFILMLYAFFIPPILMVQLCVKIEALGHKVIGW